MNGKRLSPPFIMRSIKSQKVTLFSCFPEKIPSPGVLGFFSAVHLPLRLHFQQKDFDTILNTLH